MLDKTTLNQVLNDWSYWQKEPDPSIPRNILQKPFSLASDLVWVIQGVRRSGKSTLLAQIMQKNILNPLDCFFINFEDPRLSQDLNYRLLDEIVSCAKENRKHSSKLFFFLDEIQNVAGWQKWLHLKTERTHSECYVITGSNASLLSGDLASALTGRHLSLELFPFDFEEYKKMKPENGVEDYLKEGGFPRVLRETDPGQLLREYFTDIIERDVRRHVQARSSLSLAQLVKSVFESTGSETSQRALAKVLGVTADTVGSYLEACELAYMLLSCPYFSFSERKRMARNTKFYPVDWGMRNAVITQGRSDRGKGLETLVYLHLRKKYGQVFYWRQKGEVDFVVQERGSILPFQVSWEGEKNRHEEALKEFYQEFPKAGPVTFVTCKNVEQFLKG